MVPRHDQQGCKEEVRNEVDKISNNPNPK